MKKKNKIENKQKMYPSDSGIDYLIKKVKQFRTEEHIRMKEKLYEVSPTLREIDEWSLSKDNLKEIWSKELGYDNNFIPQYVSFEDIKKLFLAYGNFIQYLWREWQAVVLEHYEKVSPNEATIKVASFIRSLKKQLIDEDDDRMIKVLQKEIELSNADLDYFKIKAEHFEKNLNSKSNDSFKEIEFIENQPQIILKKEVTEFAKRMIETKILDINDKYFVRDAKKKFIAGLDVEISAANRESIRTYLSNIKGAYNREIKRGKRKKK